MPEPDTTPTPDDRAPKPAPPPHPADEPDAEPADGAGTYRYDGPDERVYTVVPVTVRPGDVVLLPHRLDGHWTRVDADATRLPDNHPADEPTEHTESE